MKKTKKTVEKPKGKKPKPQSLADELNLECGISTFMSIGQALDVPYASSGSLSIDVATGIGGWPFGRIIEIFGPESSGKTTIAAMGGVARQKMGDIVAYVDAEHAVDLGYFKNIVKLDLSKDAFALSQPDHGEQAFDIVINTLKWSIKKKRRAYIVVDSVAALIPKKELENPMEKETMGLHARLMSRGLRKILKYIAASGSTVVFINQIRMKIGVMYGNPETTTGGNSLKFYASIRAAVRSGGPIKDGKKTIGYRPIIRLVKNKMAMPHKTAEYDAIANRGIDREGETLDVACKLGVLPRKGQWFYYKGEKFAGGRPKAVDKLRQRPELMAKIQTACLEKAKKDALESLTEKPKNKKSKKAGKK